jgi:hypothetical protein
MNSAFRALVDKVGLNNPEMEQIRFKFCFACASSIHHLLELDEALSAYRDFQSYLAGSFGQFELKKHS